MYDCMEGHRRLLIEAMVFLLSELTAQAGRKPSLVDNAYVALKEVIRDGVLPPGYQGSEQEIAGKLNISRTPVHEAIIRLQSEGLVKVLPKRGVLVCSISPDDMREIYDVNIACESMAAELLAALLESERRIKAGVLVVNGRIARIAETIIGPVSPCRNALTQVAANPNEVRGRAS